MAEPTDNNEISVSLDGIGDLVRRLKVEKLSREELFESVGSLGIFHSIMTILTLELTKVARRIAKRPGRTTDQLETLVFNQDLLLKVSYCLFQEACELESRHLSNVQSSSDETIDGLIRKLASKMMKKRSNYCKRKPVSWTVPIAQEKETKLNQAKNDSKSGKTGQEPTLQQAFESKCPAILEKLELRAGKINAKSEIRRRTAEIRRQRALHEYTLSRRIEEERKRRNALLKSTEPRKLLSEKEMKSRSARIYSSLPEVESKKEQQKKEEESRRHRMVSQIFSQRLKSQALRGHVSLPITERISCW